MTRKMQLRCCAYDTNDHVRQHRLAYNFCARPRGMGDVFLEPHLLEIKKKPGNSVSNFRRDRMMEMV